MEAIRLWFIGILAIIMMATYGYQSITLSNNAMKCEKIKISTNSDTEKSCIQLLPTERFKTLLMTLQGLISSLVIAVLAVTPVGKAPNLKFLAKNLGENQLKIVKYVSIAYLLVWGTTGGYAVFVGYLRIGDATADKFQLLLDVGWSWFALAVGAAYAFLGIEPE